MTIKEQLIREIEQAPEASFMQFMQIWQLAKHPSTYSLMLRRSLKRFQGMPFQVRLLQSSNIQLGFESEMIELRIKFENLQFHISPQICKEMISLTVNCSSRRFR